jgi:hypothetical protein
LIFYCFFLSPMAQADHESGKTSAPLPTPPGLDASNGSTPAATASTEGSATKASLTPEQQVLMAEVRRAVMEDIDAKVDQKMKDVLAKGNKMLKNAEQESQQKNAKMLEELAVFQKRQDELEAETTRLKTLMNAIVQHLAVFGAACAEGAKAASHGAPSTACSASGDANNSSSAASACSAQDSPLPDPLVNTGNFAHLPPVPDFPFPAAATGSSVATPLSLAEALNAEGPSPSVQVSLMGSLALNSPKCFSFTLRKADGTDLGLNVSHQENDKSLQVEGVRPEGAVEAWNRQCLGSPGCEHKAVLAGDRIVSVNAVAGDPAKMLEECRDRQLLKLTVLRGEVPKNTTLRTDAPEFVPGGGAPGLDAEKPAEESKDTGVAAEKAEKAEKVEKTEDC